MITVNFLGWLSNIADGVMGTIEAGIRTLCFSLCTFIYQAIIFVYNIFGKLCTGRFLSSEILQAFSERIGLILGLVMVFIVISSLIKMVLDPDKITDKEMGAATLVKKVIIVIIMLGVSNYVFNALYTVQKVVIKENVISKLLLPVRLDEETSDNFGNVLAEELLSAFYQINVDEDSTSTVVGNCQSIVNRFRNEIVKNGEFSLGYECLNQMEQADGDSSNSFIVSFNWLLAVIVGVVVVYLLFSYCISVGIRMVQLMFLEIISPMAIVSYLAPKKDTMFSKWSKMYISTYINVFIRIAIINFVVFLIATMFSTSEFSVFWGSIGGEPENTLEKGFITAIIVIALLTFAKKAPDLLKELFPAGASKLGYGIGSPKQLFDGMLGGKHLQSGLRRGYGMAAVGTGRAIGNMRNAIGKAWEANDNIKNDDRLNALLSSKKEALAAGDDRKVQMLNEGIKRRRATLNKDRNKWIGRAATGALGGLFGGAVAGAKTTDVSGRKGAVSSGVKNTKNNWKTTDAGYTHLDRIIDTPKRVVGRDTDLDNKIYAKELEAKSKQQYVANLQKDYVGPTIAKARTGDGYIIDNTFVKTSDFDSYITDKGYDKTIIKIGKEIADGDAAAGKLLKDVEALRNEKDKQQK